mgnify:CR=1 FL=1
MTIRKILTAVFAIAVSLSSAQAASGNATEAAAKAKGGKGVTGADVRDALLSQSFPSESFFGVLPAMKFGTDAPFPTQGNSVNIGTVEKGKYKLKQASVPVPAVNKW